MNTKQKLTRLLGVTGWSQDKLADLLQVSNNTLSAWVKGKAEPHARHTALIDKIFADLSVILPAIDRVADEVEKDLLQTRIHHLPDDNFRR
jgi:transcriptional regulator with XRE-family HTH domain